MRNGSSMPTAVLQPRVPKGLQKCKLFYFCEKLNCHCRKAGAGHALGWALAAPFRDQLWFIGLERSPFPCIVWVLQFLQYLLGIPVALRSNKKALKQVNVFHISVFQVEFVGYPATTAVSLTVWLGGKKAQKCFLYVLQNQKHPGCFVMSFLTQCQSRALWIGSSHPSVFTTLSPDVGICWDLSAWVSRSRRGEQPNTSSQRHSKLKVQ